ncbi:MAG: hypothetical protein C0172_01650, partial [Caldisphaera sp.]
ATVDLKDSSGNILQEVTADSAGRFLFTGVNSGVYTVEVKETGYVGVDKSVSITTKNKNISIKAIPSAGGTAAVTGKVADASGNGIGGLVVQLMKEDPRFGSTTMGKYVVDKATTAQDGTYTLKAIKPADTSTFIYYVRVLGHGIKNTMATGQFNVTKDTTTVANENVTVDVLPTTTATITGQVLDAVGNPVANAKVTAPLKEVGYPETVTNANGEFSIVVPANGILQVPIRVSKSGYQSIREVIIPNANTTFALQTITLVSK